MADKQQKRDAAVEDLKDATQRELEPDVAIKGEDLVDVATAGDPPNQTEVNPPRDERE